MSWSDDLVFFLSFFLRERFEWAEYCVTLVKGFWWNIQLTLSLSKLKSLQTVRCKQVCFSLLLQIHTQLSKAWFLQLPAHSLRCAGIPFFREHKSIINMQRAKCTEYLGLWPISQDKEDFKTYNCRFTVKEYFKFQHFVVEGANISNCAEHYANYSHSDS